MLDSSSVLQNRYRVIRELGRGGMGAVYHAWDMRLSIPVALKEMIPQSDHQRRDFAGIAQAVSTRGDGARAPQPSAPGWRDGFLRGRPQYLPGDAVRRRAEPFGTDQAIRRAAGGCRSSAGADSFSKHFPTVTARASSTAISSRRISSSARMERAVLVDFGLVKLWDPNDPKTRTAVRGIGTPQYAPPEQYELEAGHTEPRSDLYSLGCDDVPRAYRPSATYCDVAHLRAGGIRAYSCCGGAREQPDGIAIERAMELPAFAALVDGGGDGARIRLAYPGLGFARRDTRGRRAARARRHGQDGDGGDRTHAAGASSPVPGLGVGAYRGFGFGRHRWRCSGGDGCGGHWAASVRGGFGYADARTDACPDGHECTYVNCGTHVHADCDAHTDAHAGPEAYVYADAYAASHADADGDPHRHPDADRRTDATAHGNARPDEHAETDGAADYASADHRAARSNADGYESPAPPPAGDIGRIIFTLKAGDAYYLYSTDPAWSQMQEVGLTDYAHSTCGGGATASTLTGYDSQSLRIQQMRADRTYGRLYVAEWGV